MDGERMRSQLENEVKMTTEKPLDYGELVETVLNYVRDEGREFDLEQSEYSDTYYDDV